MDDNQYVFQIVLKIVELEPQNPAFATDGRLDPMKIYQYYRNAVLSLNEELKSERNSRD